MIIFKQHSNENRLQSLNIGLKCKITNWLNENNIHKYELNNNFEIIIYENLLLYKIKIIPDFINIIKIIGNIIILNYNDLNKLLNFNKILKGNVDIIITSTSNNMLINSSFRLQLYSKNILFLKDF